jgi:PAS domain S-box-containing protein
VNIKIKIIAISTIAGILLGILESLLDYFFFFKQSYTSFFQILNPFSSGHELFVRLIILSSFIILGISIAGMIKKLQASEKSLNDQKYSLGKLNEELEATNEELHATNEEFETINNDLMRSQTDLLELNAILSESEEKFKIVSEQHHTGIIIFQESNLIYSNPMSASLTEYHLKEMSEWRYDDFTKLLHQDDIQFIINYQKMIDSKISIDTPVFTRLRTKSGRIKWIELFLKGIMFKNRPATMISFSDITVRKRYEDELIDSEKRYRELYDSILDGYVRLDKDGWIVEFNDAFKIMTSCAESELTGLQYTDLLNPKSQKHYKKITEEQVKIKGHTDLFESEIIRENGDILPVEMRTYLLKNEDGEYDGVWSIMHDIKKRKIAENEMLKSSKIESLGIFAGGIAHDFNNLLTAIIGNISVAKYSSNLEDDLYKTLTDAENASLRAKDLTHQLLTFSKGGAPLKAVTFIKGLLVDTAEFVLSGSKIKAEYSIPDSLWNADIDKGQISQVIHNIVLNARQVMNEGGIVKISAQNKNVTAIDNIPVQDGKYIQISIKDNGPGIQNENIAHIFDPFFTTKEKGSGLGLSITYSIIKKHEGHIEVRTDIGKGTLFNIYLPATEECPLERIDPDSKITTGKAKARILIMDDEDFVLKTAKKMILKMGHDVFLAKDGDIAIKEYKKAKVESNPYDIVIMDLTIPGSMGGKSAINELKIFDPQVKAIVSSGYSNDPVMANYRDYGFTAVIPKPYTYEELYEIIYRVLNGNRS